MACLALLGRISGWARSIHPGLCIAFDDDEVWLGRDLLYETELCHISIGGIGRIGWPAIQKYLVHAAGLQFRCGRGVGMCRNIPIENAIC